MHPTPLVRGRRNDLRERRPETQRAVTSRQFLRVRPAGLGTSQHFASVRGGLSCSVLDNDQVLLAVSVHAHQHPHADFGLSLRIPW